MIATTVAEGTVASPATETNLDSKQQPSFCEANHSSDSNNNNNNNTSSPAYKDVEDTFQGNGIPQMSEANDNSSYWALFLKAYVPLIMIWFRKSMFGPANLVRTMVVGQVMKWVVSGDFHEILSKKFPRLEAILFPPTNGKLDPHAWPPPAFTALALLTVLALVVHPDGLTWVLLGKLRDAIFAFFRALGQSLEFLLNDYGVFPTIIAATTLAAMFFLVFVVIRTLSPKPQKMDKQQQQQQQHNNNSNNSINSNMRYRDGRRVSPRHKESDRMVRQDEDYRTSNRRDYNSQGFPQYESSSYLSSFCRWCCTFQHFCYVVQLVNCFLVVGLIYFVMNEYPKIQALDRLDELQTQLEQNHADIEALQEEVHTKQEGQLNDIEESLKQEQRNNFLSFAGIFTLLTCLISMFHMTTHVHKLCQPKIQRKIIAILWMSPIYSVTSFLSLIFPPIEGWMAIVKDFYESYCIFVFLSFLIAVLGEGSRDKAVEVLAKHADHLDQPTRCLGCFYEPSPSTSDHAKANAVMTQCQIYCLQFTIIRPITTIIRVFVLNRNKDEETAEEEEEDMNEDEFSDISSENDVDVDSNSTSNTEIYYPTNTTESLLTGTDMGDEPITEPSYPQSNNDTDTTTSSHYENDRNSGNGGVRKLQNTNSLRRKRQDRWLQLEGSEEEKEEIPPSIGNSLNNNDQKNDPFAQFPTVAPVTGNDFPTSLGDDFLSPAFVEETGMPTEDGGFPPTFGSYGSDTKGPTFPTNAAMPFDYGNATGGFGNMFDANTTANFSPTIVPTMSPSFVNDTSFASNELVDQTKAYFRSPGFALAMVVNVSIFFAFSGLLKLYHAVREDLLWCRPFPKFLTIKAVVFLTFWQGLAILIYLILAGVEDASLQAHRYQNMLICVEMLLVAISQWCVFPAVEWEPDYEPRNMQTPGLGIKDFVSDVGQIVKKSRKGRRRKKRGGTPNGSKSGLYHMPGFASIVSSQFDGFGGPNRGARADSSDFGENSSLDQSYDSSSTLERENGVGTNTEMIENENDTGAYGLPSSVPQGNRDRIHSDDTGGYSIEDEGSDHDMELL